MNYRKYIMRGFSLTLDCLHNMRERVLPIWVHVVCASAACRQKTWFSENSRPFRLVTLSLLEPS